MNTVKEYTKDLSQIKEFLAKQGWKIIKFPKTSAKDFCSQGVVYMNFEKDGLGLHLEYGDDSCVFGEEDG